MDTGPSEVLSFKLFRTEAATPTVQSPATDCNHIRYNKHRCPHYFPADKVFSMDTFPHFQRMKEAFTQALS